MMSCKKMLEEKGICGVYTTSKCTFKFDYFSS